MKMEFVLIKGPPANCLGGGDFHSEDARRKSVCFAPLNFGSDETKRIWIFASLSANVSQEKPQMV